ncbi:hypothetical protein [Paludibaculum fermentans]|uniref:Uncharacterized protein n=1 Tax=Paludibaculum fermentans TaxID=1473598 RepID=A0A7S7NT90_PALFE|nr:hypothetical protein [Paludibaculum fermentans]QOY89308.1 hypothetical protein IRI77_04950 [Paludibaculum fermentans]
MALLVDGDLSRLDDLKAQDAGVLDVANGEGLDPRAKLDLAAGEIQEEVEAFLDWEETGRVDQVVASVSLKRWHVLKTLEAVYRDAYFSQLNDRYGQKWRHFEALAEEQRRRYFESGVQMAAQPVRRPSRVSAEIGEGVTGAATYWVQATLLDAERRESAASAAVAVSSPVPHSLLVSVLFPEENATHWNLYAGADEASVGLQNAEPLPVGETWMLPASGLVSGRPPGNGQTADFRVVRSGLLRRG